MRNETETYTIKAHCGNCGHKQRLRYRKGVTVGARRAGVFVTPNCDNCGCQSLRKSGADRA